MSQEPAISVLHDWDNIIIQINRGDEKIGAIRAMKQDIDNMIDFHKMTRADILELLTQTLETTPKED